MSRQKNRLHHKLNQVADALQSVCVLRGVLLSAAAFGTALILAAITDNMLHLPSWLRGVGLFVLLGLGAYLAIRHLICPLLRRPSEEEAALAAERRYPDAENLLINAVQLSRRQLQGLSKLMAERVLEEASQFAARIEPQEVADRAPLRRVGIAAAAVAFCLAVYLLVAPAHFANALTRYIRFRADIPPITATKLTVHPGNCHVLWGEPLTITASVKADTPTQAFIRINGGETTPMRFDGKRFSYTVASVRAPFSYPVAAGDASAACVKPPGVCESVA